VAHIFLLIHDDYVFSLLFMMDGSVTHLFLFMCDLLYCCFASDVLDLIIEKFEPPYTLYMGCKICTE
jgi:hypothetical protein